MPSKWTILNRDLSCINRDQPVAATLNRYQPRKQAYSIILNHDSAFSVIIGPLSLSTIFNVSSLSLSTVIHDFNAYQNRSQPLSTTVNHYPCSTKNYKFSANISTILDQPLNISTISDHVRCRLFKDHGDSTSRNHWCQPGVVDHGDSTSSSVPPSWLGDARNPSQSPVHLSRATTCHDVPPPPRTRSNGI